MTSPPLQNTLTSIMNCFIGKSHYKWFNSLLGALGSSEPCCWRLPYLGMADRSILFGLQYRKSSRFTTSSWVSHLQSFCPLLSSGGCVIRGAACGAHGHNPAACYCQRQGDKRAVSSKTQVWDGFIGALESKERRWVELPLHSKHIWSEMVERKRNI